MASARSSSIGARRAEATTTSAEARAAPRPGTSEPGGGAGRHSAMRRSTATLALSLLVLGAGCGGAEGGTATPDPPPSTRPPVATTTAPPTTAPPTTGEANADTATLMAEALHQLVTVDTTFGAGHRFSELLVLTRLDPAAGSGTPSGGEGSDRPLTDAERAAIEAALSDVAPIRWIDDAEAWRTDDLMPTVEGSAIVGVGEPTFDDDGALVPVSLWCGGLCGTWFDYRAVPTDGGGWDIIGPEGPIAIS